MGSLQAILLEKVVHFSEEEIKEVPAKPSTFQLLRRDQIIIYSVNLILLIFPSRI